MKLSGEELKKMLKCIKKDSRVLVPPMIGFDFGVHQIDGKQLVVSTDPCTGVPAEWFGFLLINYAASDLALSGAKPEFCTINLLGPRSATAEDFQKVMQQTCKAADELDIAIVRGHTGTYDSIKEMLGVCTVYGVAPEKLITPKGIKPGDLILCTKPLGLETLTNFSLTCPEKAVNLFGAQPAKLLASQVPPQSCVKEALALAQLEGVHAMHDVTEGGFLSAINELAQASDLGIYVDWAKLVFCSEAFLLQKKFGLSDVQLMSMSSTGTILAAVDPKAKQAVSQALQALDLPAYFVGYFTQNQKRGLIKNSKETDFPQTQDDPYTRILSGKE